MHITRHSVVFTREFVVFELRIEFVDNVHRLPNHLGEFAFQTNVVDDGLIRAKVTGKEERQVINILEFGQSSWIFNDPLGIWREVPCLQRLQVIYIRKINVFSVDIRVHFGWAGLR